MDSVRFGRALGIGARHAVKALVTAADAAATPNPSPQKAAPQRQTSPTRQPVTGEVIVQRATRTAAQTTSQVRHTKEGLKRGGKRFGEAVWGPLIKLSGVLWLEFTGVFFGLFVLFAGGNAWKLRGHLHQTAQNHNEHQHLLWSIGMTLLFGYFCLTSFLRAARRGRRP